MSKKRLVVLVIFALAALFLPASQAERQIITDISVSAAPVASFTPGPQITAIPTPEPTPTAEPTPEPTAEPTPTVQPTPEPTVQPTPTPTPEPTSTPEPTATPEPTPAVQYEIDVDLANQIVTVYREGDRSQAGIARQMICSSGTGNNTPTGTFIMPENQKLHEREAWYYIAKYRLHVQYASRIVDSILFHSLPSKKEGLSPTEDSLQALGERASHGCIRLRPADSCWIAQHCPAGTTVNIFEDAQSDETLRELLLQSSFVSEEMTYDEFLAGEQILSVSSGTPEVLDLQLQLNLLGYDCSETDGIFGADTRRAVQQWQSDHGLEPTDEVNQELLFRIMIAEPDPESVTSKGRSAHVKVDTALTLRSAPNSKSRKLDALQNGAQVWVLEETGGWYKVRHGSQTGYVGRQYIEFTSNDTEVN